MWQVCQPAAATGCLPLPQNWLLTIPHSEKLDCCKYYCQNIPLCHDCCNFLKTVTNWCTSEITWNSVRTSRWSTLAVTHNLDRLICQTSENCIEMCGYPTSTEHLPCLSVIWTPTTTWSLIAHPLSSSIIPLNDQEIRKKREEHPPCSEPVTDLKSERYWHSFWLLDRIPSSGVSGK